MNETNNPYTNRLGLDDTDSGYDWATHEGVKVIGDFHHGDMVQIVWPLEMVWTGVDTGTKESK